jgi:hypothetical protein
MKRLPKGDGNRQKKKIGMMNKELALKIPPL